MPLIVNFLLGFLWWVIALPIVWVIATPVILLSSLSGEGKYLTRVSQKYRGVTDFWKEHGILLVP